MEHVLSGPIVFPLSPMNDKTVLRKWLASSTTCKRGSICSHPADDIPPAPAPDSVCSLGPRADNLRLRHVTRSPRIVSLAACHGVFSLFRSVKKKISKSLSTSDGNKPLILCHTGFITYYLSFITRAWVYSSKNRSPASRKKITRFVILVSIPAFSRFFNTVFAPVSDIDILTKSNILWKWAEKICRFFPAEVCVTMLNAGNGTRAVG